MRFDLPIYITKDNKRANRFLYNRWQRRICTLSVHLYSYVTSVNSVFVSDKIIIDSNISAYLTVK